MKINLPKRIKTTKLKYQIHGINFKTQEHSLSLSKRFIQGSYLKSPLERGDYATDIPEGRVYQVLSKGEKRGRKNRECLWVLPTNYQIEFNPILKEHREEIERILLENPMDPKGFA